MRVVRKIAYTPIRGVGVLLEFSNKRQRTDISELMKCREGLIFRVIVMIKIPLTQFTNCFLIVYNLLNFNL
jgi:hypothetical protein